MPPRSIGFMRSSASKLDMGTMLLGFLMAAIVLACETVPPSASLAAPSVEVRPSLPPSPTQFTGYTVDCGPLAGAPDECTAAVDEALQAMRPLVPSKDFSAVRIDPEPTCTAPCDTKVIVSAFKDLGAAMVAQVSLVRAGSGWSVVAIPMAAH